MVDYKTKLSLLPAVAALLLFLPGIVAAEKPVAPEDIPGANRVDAEALVALVLSTPDLVIIDARREEEHAKGHIEGAVSLLDAEMTEESLAGLVPNKDTPVAFYCNGVRCARSTNAVHMALEWGYRRVYWFRGGWTEWTDKQLPVSR